MINVSDKHSEDQNRYFIFNNVFPKILQFMRQCGNMR